MDTVPPLLCVVQFVQIVLGLYDTTCRPLYLFVYIVHSLHDTTVASPRPSKGTRTVPFFILPCGACYFFDLGKCCNLYILYKVPGDTTVALRSTTWKGDPNGPLIFNQPCGAFYYFDLNKSGSPFAFCLLDPGSTCKYL